MIYELMWIVVTIGAIISYFYIIKNWKQFKASPEKREMNTARIIFIITARYTELLIQETIDVIHKSCLEAGLKYYDVKLIVDEKTTDKYSGLNIPKEKTLLKNVDIITVPDDYPQTTRFKARALMYALTKLPNDEEIWFHHLDEDTIVTKQCIMSLMKYVEEDGHPVACGPILYSSKIKNIYTLFIEAHRIWTHFWLISQMNSSRPLYINGSNLLIRSDIEHKVGWEFGASLIEDSRFAIEVEKKFKNAFGWHGGIAIEQPPSNIMACFRQRRRWFAGGLQNLKYMDKYRILQRTFNNLCWVLSFGVTLMFFIIIISNIFDLGIYSINPMILSIMGITVFMWLLRYQIGMKMILDYTDYNISKKVFLHISMVIFTPITELLSSTPTVWAIINPPKSFDITKKI